MGQIIFPFIRRTIPDDSTVFKILKDVSDRPNDEITTNSEKAYAMVFKSFDAGNYQVEMTLCF